MGQRYMAAGWWREALRHQLRWLAAASSALGLAACSFDLPSFAPEQIETTGSIAPAAPVSPLSPALEREDWRRARAAMAVALDPQGAGTAVNWDNPETRHRGTFTADGKPFVEANEICRAFDARLVLADRILELQGTACRLAADDWEIRKLEPSKRG